ncbi:C4-dicarboxylate ABC transporter substrate-binding protein [Bradyrhizobium jicamae]|uniref:C4-dicarboxylate ABC transporter substrate-binding protein n=1 Tax=Bradyrhizobium jicamae TaxID=280332 RepID=A0ABS5FSP5_9BRAD|nr:TAXI family TRAP transporter solute-binding subunit [Bradyrhizobium jicamae]MBR0799793.1 C4-dicarboxylate ABC transporter substrate-binding protein [Bradyrhizobium jicamae]MBR0934021.1 C4-dicarboxylate ABC transporter substrate-binding protein [Bradyrhizobium jicamae]
MSAEAPTPSSILPPPRARVVKSNRAQIVIFSILTLILSAATVWGGRVWLRNSETLVFAVGDANGPEARFATRLKTVLKANSSRLRLKVAANPDNAKALAQFDRRDADLAILRTDARVPPRARAIAILEHDVVLVLSPGDRKIKSLSDLRKKKVAVVGDGENSVNFVRSALEISDSPDVAQRVQQAPPNTPFEKLFASGFAAVIAIEHTSKIVKDKTFEQYAKRGGFTLNAIDSAKSLARKYPAISEETVSTGMLSASPAIPDDDVDTIGLEWLLVAQSQVSTSTAAELARMVYENKAELVLDDGFASRIEPAATDKDAFIMAHQGAAQYINDDTKSFMDRYSDMMYLAAAALSVIGSIFAAIYAKITRIAPEKASELATRVLDIGEQIENTTCIEHLDQLQDELEKILRHAVVGLRDGTVSSDGLETFKLGYEFVRDDIALRRDHLKRHPVQPDDNVVVVKAASG